VKTRPWLRKDSKSAHMTQSNVKRLKVISANDYTKRSECLIGDMESEIDFDLEEEVKLLKSKYL
jgi:hypothetical protein